MPTVSVIIPTYRHRDFVLTALESVFSQTFTDHEVIVVNDGSPDDTPELLKPLAEAGRIRYIEQTNQGQAAARNRGLAEAQGEFVAFLDDDDLWPPDKLEWQVRGLRDNPSLGMVAGGMQTFDNNVLPVPTIDAPPVMVEFEQIFYGSPITSPGQALMRSDVLRAVGGFDTSIWGADDYDLWFRLTRVTQVQLWQRVALHYRKHSLNASRDLPRMYQNCENVLRRQLKTVLPRNRFRYHRGSYRFLYNYVGKQIILQSKLLVLAGDARGGFRQVLPLRSLLTSLLLDPKLASLVCRDLMSPQEGK